MRLRRTVSHSTSHLESKKRLKATGTVEIEGARKIAYGQYQRETEAFTAQRSRDVTRLDMLGGKQRLFPLACRKQFRQLGSPRERPRNEGRMIARTFQR